MTSSTRPTRHPRLALLRPEDLSEAQREIHRSITSGPRAGDAPSITLINDDGSLPGPFNAMLYRPDLGDALQQLGAVLRFSSSLPARAKEAAILVVAAHVDSPFELYAHERLGRAAGLTEQEIDSLRTGADPLLSDPIEVSIYCVAKALVSGADVDDASFEEAVRLLGEARLVEVASLVGYYWMIAGLMRLFRITP